MGCFSCCYSVSKGDKFESYKGQEQFKVLFDQCSASSQPDSGRSKLNALQQFGSENDFEQKPAAAAEMFTLAEMIHATSNWSPSHKIGQGGFGLVYKGRLRDGRMVAIKRGRKDQFAHRLSSEFRTEVEMLSQVDHLNLVKLIGYLEEGPESILVVEYVPNGTLGSHLDGTHKNTLDMSTRLDIAIDIAHALTYLHLYADRPIIHRDIKSSNILITEKYRAKVADFGFSRVGPATEAGATHVSTQVKGTAGYLDPEYLHTYQLHTKSDVYSFGILLVEIFTGRRPIELRRPSDERITVRWAFKKFVEGKVVDILDPKIEKTPATLSIIEPLAELAFACSAPTKADRPSMKKATEVLWDIRKDYMVAHQRSLKAQENDNEKMR